MTPAGPSCLRARTHVKVEEPEATDWSGLESPVEEEKLHHITDVYSELGPVQERVLKGK